MHDLSKFPELAEVFDCGPRSLYQEFERFVENATRIAKAEALDELAENVAIGNPRLGALIRSESARLLGER